MLIGDVPVVDHDLLLLFIRSISSMSYPGFRMSRCCVGLIYFLCWSRHFYIICGVGWALKSFTSITSHHHESHPHALTARHSAFSIQRSALSSISLCTTSNPRSAWMRLPTSLASKQVEIHYTSTRHLQLHLHQLPSNK